MERGGRENTAGRRDEARRSPRAVRPRGAVLLLVMGSVALLSILALKVSQRANVEVSRAARLGRDAAFRRAFDSGLELGKGLWSERRTQPEFDFWEGWQQRVGLDLSEDVKIEVSVADESGKFDLHSLTGQDREGGDLGGARKRLKRLFEYLRGVEPEREEVWMQAERAVAERVLGSEGRKAGPLPTLDGLRETGLPLELVFPGVRKTGDGFGAASPGRRPISLSEVLTVFGGEQVNINTAPKAVLYALDDEFGQELVDQISAYRGEARAEEEIEHQPFRSPADLERVDGVLQRAEVDGETVVTKNLYSKVSRLIGVKSRCFSVRVVARVGERARQAFGFFEEARTPRQKCALRKVAFEEIEP